MLDGFMNEQVVNNIILFNFYVDIYLISVCFFFFIFEGKDQNDVNLFEKIAF